MSADLKKRPAYLIGLIERRARAAAEEHRLRMILKDFGRDLAAARRRVQSYDLAIKDYNPKLDPAVIEPVYTPRTGPRGKLTGCMLALLEANRGKWLSNTEIAAHAERELGLVFHSFAARNRWKHNSVAKQLREWYAEGKIERAADDEIVSQFTEAGVRWRLK